MIDVSDSLQLLALSHNFHFQRESPAVIMCWARCALIDKRLVSWWPVQRVPTDPASEPCKIALTADLDRQTTACDLTVAWSLLTIQDPLYEYVGSNQRGIALVTVQTGRAIRERLTHDGLGAKQYCKSDSCPEAWIVREKKGGGCRLHVLRISGDASLCPTIPTVDTELDSRMCSVQRAWQ